jgi:hypothetical protein
MFPSCGTQWLHLAETNVTGKASTNQRRLPSIWQKAIGRYWLLIGFALNHQLLYRADFCIATGIAKLYMICKQTAMLWQ